MSDLSPPVVTQRELAEKALILVMAKKASFGRTRTAPGEGEGRRNKRYVIGGLRP